MGADKPDSWFIMKFAAGSLAGGIGSLAGNPFDVLKTQMMTAAQEKPPTFGEGVAALYKNQGIGGFYRGLEANVARAMVLNGTKMSCYDEIKQTIIKSELVPVGEARSSVTLPLSATASLPHSIPASGLIIIAPHSHRPLSFSYIQAGIPTQFASAMGAGFFMACTVS